MQAAWRVLFIFSALDARGTVRSTSKGWIEKIDTPYFVLFICIIVSGEEIGSVDIYKSGF
mgnify:FL=1